MALEYTYLNLYNEDDLETLVFVGNAYAGEPVLKGYDTVGIVTSGTYGHRVGKSLAFALIDGGDEVAGKQQLAWALQRCFVVDRTAPELKLVGDPELRERLGGAARARAQEHFTASAMAERYVSLYTE